jgi:hypothetical protein
MKRTWLFGFVVLAVLSLAACATIIAGQDQEISITSEPSGAKVVIYDANNLPVWDSTTPGTATLKKGRGYFEAAQYRVEVTKAGYAKQEFMITGDLDMGWYLIGNFFIGGLLGWLVIDPLTGAMWTLSPDMIYAPLGQQGAIPDKEGNLVVILKQDIPEEVYTSLELVRVD